MDCSEQGCISKVGKFSGDRKTSAKLTTYDYWILFQLI